MEVAPFFVDFHHFLSIFTIYALLSQFTFCRDLRTFSAIFFGQNSLLRNITRFLHVTRFQSLLIADSGTLLTLYSTRPSSKYWDRWWYQNGWIFGKSFRGGEGVWSDKLFPLVSQERPNMISSKVTFADNDQNHCFLFARQSQRGQIWSDFIGSSPFLRLHSGSATPFTTP